MLCVATTMSSPASSYPSASVSRIPLLCTLYWVHRIVFIEKIRKLWIAAHSFQFTKANCLINVSQFRLSVCTFFSLVVILSLTEGMFIRPNIILFVLQCMHVSFAFVLAYAWQCSIQRFILWRRKKNVRNTNTITERQLFHFHCPSSHIKSGILITEYNSLFTLWDSFYVRVWAKEWANTTNNAFYSVIHIRLTTINATFWITIKIFLQWWKKERRSSRDFAWKCVIKNKAHNDISYTLCSSLFPLLRFY